MNLKEAEKIVQNYGGALAKGTEEGSFRRESWLPENKNTIIQAFKLVIAFLIEYESWNNENFSLYMNPLLAIDAFERDDKVDRMIETNRLIKNKELSFNSNDSRVKELQEYFVNSIRSNKVVTEMDEFIKQVSEFDKDDPLYHQRIYTLIGLEYSNDKKKSFMDIFKFWK